MKECSSCHTPKEGSEFYKESKTKDGLAYRCKDCDRKRGKEYRATSNTQKNCTKKWRNLNKDKVHAQKRRLYCKVQEFRDFLKTIHKCMICQESEICCLDFDHLFDKERAVVSYGTFKSCIAELTKCIVLCSNCHRKRHAKIITVNLKPFDYQYLLKLFYQLYPEVVEIHNKSGIKM